MAIKMRINQNKKTRCDECNTSYKNTPEMYDIILCDEKFSLCFDCMDILFHKTLKAGVIYNGKVKRKEDQERIKRYNVLKGKE